MYVDMHGLPFRLKPLVDAGDSFVRIWKVSLLTNRPQEFPRCDTVLSFLQRAPTCDALCNAASGGHFCTSTVL